MVNIVLWSENILYLQFYATFAFLLKFIFILVFQNAVKNSMNLKSGEKKEKSNSQNKERDKQKNIRVKKKKEKKSQVCGILMLTLHVPSNVMVAWDQNSGIMSC